MSELLAWNDVTKEKPPITDWRPASPTMPRCKKIEVIVATKEGRVFATTYSGGALGFANINSRTDEVTHWMMMPKHPAS